MKALVLAAASQLEYKDVAEPEVGPEEVLIRVRACGICGSDVHGLDGSTGRRRPPIIMGHEAAGVIERLGQNVAGWQVGERVTFDSTIFCGHCGPCRAGRVNLCENRRVLGVSCADYRRDGAFAEFVTVPQHILYRLPESVTFAQAAMIEALAVAAHAVERPRLRLGDTVVVVGAGMIGLLVLQVLKLKGCGRIIALDVDPAKLRQAEKFGADLALPADREESLQQIRDLTAGRGADVVFDVVGLPASLRTALAAVRAGGTLTLVGNLATEVPLALQSVVTRELTVLGSCASSGEYPACLYLLASGRVDVDSLISATPPLAEGASWFERLYRKEPGLFKVILQPA